MSNDTLVYNTLTDLAKVPGARMMWGPRPPKPPYFVYETWPRSVYADDADHATVDRYKATLYMSRYDDELVTRFEDAISTLGTYIRHSDAVEDGLCVLTWGLSLARRAD